MDSQDHKTTTATSAGHEGHGAHVCHRCGWPFPNPHPSAKHRRAHKKVCGTIEGYHVIQSEDGDTHLAVTVDEDDSDDEVHSPSPKLVKETSSEVTGSGGIGEKAKKSEDDVFSDAATGFSDSGLSQRSEESFEAVTGNTDHKGKDDARQQLMVDEISEKTEQINDQTNSTQTRESGVINADVQSERVAYHTNDAGTISPPILVGLRDSVKPGNLIKDGDMVASLTMKSGEKISELDSANEQVVADSVQLTGSIDTAGEKALAKKGHEDIEAFVESNSMKKSDVDNKETDSHAVESINVGRLANESERDSRVVTSDGTLEQASSKELIPESTEVSDELRDGQVSKVLVESVDSENSNSTMQEALNENGTCKNETFTDTTGHVGATKSQSSDKLTTNEEEEKVKDIEAEPDKTEASEPPSFTTSVQSGGEVHVETSSEIENSQNNQQSKSSALQVGSLPSLTNVVNESEGIKENKEIVEKVTESSPAIQHNPLKALLDEAKSPNTKYDQKEEAKSTDDAAYSTTVKSILDEEATKDQETGKYVEEQNSPARDPIENTKAKKKKKKSYWAPFMCCSSGHRDTYEQL